jgi:hypothetical protein
MSWETLHSRTMRFKPGFDERIAHPYAWYERKVNDGGLS